uniref:DNA pilot protein n=1 Tax=Dulem virus 269 TaxID=3145746 RepID=A0AAU8B833_9VIRU
MATLSNDPALSNGSSYDDKRIRSNYNWSENNPYVEALKMAKHGTRRQDLLEAALNWEESYGNFRLQNEREDELLQRQRDWELEDRAHEEEYSSPAAQAYRDRIAGINPDLQEISSGTSLDPQNDLGTAATVDNVGVGLRDPTQVTLDKINSVFSAASSIIDIGGSLLGSARNIVDWNSNSRFARANASAAEQATLRNDFDIANNRLSSLSNAASILSNRVDEKGNSIPLTANGLMQFYSDAGYPIDEETRALANKFVNSSDIRALAATNRYAMKRQEAMNEVYTPDMLTREFEMSYKLRMKQMEGESFRADYTAAIQKALAEDESYASDVANATISAASNESDYQQGLLDRNSGDLRSDVEVGELKTRQARYNDILQQFALFVDTRNKAIREIDDELKSIGDLKSASVADYQRAISRKQARAYLIASTYDEMYNFGQSMAPLYRALALGSATSNSKSVFGLDATSNFPIALYNMYWTPGVAGTDVVRPLLQGVAATGTAVGSAALLKKGSPRLGTDEISRVPNLSADGEYNSIDF